MEKVSKEARDELVKALRARYRLAPKRTKTNILDEFVQVSGFHRKHAIRRLVSEAKEGSVAVVMGRSIYDDAVRQALVVIWEAADRICGKRLKAIIPSLVAAMERHGHLQLDLVVRERLMTVSASTIDRLLKMVRKGAGSRRKRRAAKRMKGEIPIKTFHEWKDPAPGFLEVDFVVHGGGSMAGEYLHSLVATDVCTGWTEAVPLLAREQSLVVEGLNRIRAQMPMRMLGIDVDNDSAFINETLASYCRREGIQLTRSRVHQKNDQAWIEQKNGSVIRRMVGHARWSGVVAGQALAQLLQTVRLYVNFFQPSFKLLGRVRDGARIKKHYDAPTTPFQRLLNHSRVDEKVKEALRVQQVRLDPVDLLRRIRQGQSALVALNSGSPTDGPGREDLAQFLSQLPELWRAGEVRPTHRKAPKTERYWRSRADPFEGAWPEILLWLQAEPDCTAKSLMDRLIEKYPDRYDGGQLRTLQRRIGEWRATMARSLMLPGGVQHHDITAISAWTGPTLGEPALRLASLTSAQTPPAFQRSEKVGLPGHPALNTEIL
jgi:hypothetical protein